MKLLHKQYQIIATLLLESPGSSLPLRTWILDAGIGIVDTAHAASIARDMLNTLTAGRQDVREILVDAHEFEPIMQQEEQGQ